MPDTLSINEFAAKVKERRPDLASIPDGTLVGKMLAAAPELKDVVRMEYTDKRGAEYKSPAAPGGFADKVADQMDAVREGVAGFVPTAAQAIGELGTVKGAMGVFNKLRSPLQAARSAVEPLTTLTKQGAELALGTLPEGAQRPARAAVQQMVPGLQEDVPSPDDPRTAEMAKAAGANLAGTLIPAVAEAAPARISPVFQRIKGALPTSNVEPVTAIERNIAPSSPKAKLSTIRNAPKLAEINPKLAEVKGPAFDQELVQTFKTAEQGVDAAESAVPRETLVPTERIADKIAELIDDFAGDERATAQLTKEWERWAGQSEMPWEDFIKVKRNIGTKLNTAAMRKAFGVLMEASGDISQELKAANRTYSVVRKGLEDSGIDRFTGRRIKATGAPPEQSKAWKAIKKYGPPAVIGTAAAGVVKDLLK